QTRAIDLAVDKQADETFVAQARCEGQFSLGDVKGGFRVTEAFVSQPGHVLERRIAHGGVISIDIQGSHQLSPLTIWAPAAFIS
ncbi:MAG TPA: hypothetical protein VFT26_07540, partial [Pyrinomonadaceae bacterium]|nr:hypothetical protein [Pyrinomonadaceae bacterium]